MYLTIAIMFFVFIISKHTSICRKIYRCNAFIAAVACLYCTR